MEMEYVDEIFHNIMEDKDWFILQQKCHVCRWHGEAKSKGINSHYAIERFHTMLSHILTMHRFIVQSDVYAFSRSGGLIVWRIVTEVKSRN